MTTLLMADFTGVGFDPPAPLVGEEDAEPAPGEEINHCEE